MDIERVFYLLKCVELNCNNKYAIAYCQAAQKSLDGYGEDGLKTQIIYVLNNLASWKGEKARAIKAELKSLA